MGSRQREARTMGDRQRAIRPRLVERQVLHAGDDARRQLPDHRHVDRVDGRHQRPRLGRRGGGGDRDARGPRQVQGAAQRQVGAHLGDARRARSVDGARPALHRGAAAGPDGRDRQHAARWTRRTRRPGARGRSRRRTRRRAVVRPAAQ